MMRMVLAALGPAACIHVWFYGIGLLFNLGVAVLAGLLTEALALRLRGKPASPFLLDGSVMVTAALLVFCLPPLCPWWVTGLAMVFAIGVAKHLFGGLGANLFNPAMAGFVLVLVLFPAAMTLWPGPDIGDLDYVQPDAGAVLRYGLTGSLPAPLELDAVARATTLDAAKEGLNRMRTMDEIRANPAFGDFGGAGWEWVNNGIALGGFALLMLGVIRWHTPVGVLGGLLGAATVAWLLDPATHPSPGFHLFSGGGMLGAFFVATDPVSSPTTPRGRLLFGIGVGALTIVIRAGGSYADGVAFAVLTMNACVPLLERWTRPRVYGHAA
jgi:electron transport complex protein RnfD